MQLVNAKTSMHMRTAILDYSQLAYTCIYIQISLSQKTPHWLAKIAQRHAPAFGERSHSVQYVALGFHPS